MASYKERLSEVIELLQKVGAKLYKEDKILGYSILTDSLHNTITNDPEGDWEEYPCAHAVFKLGKLDSPRYFYIKAKIKRGEGKGAFGLSSPKIGNFPEIFNSIQGLERKTEEYYYTDVTNIASRLTKAIEEYKKIKNKVPHLFLRTYRRN